MVFELSSKILYTIVRYVTESLNIKSVDKVKINALCEFKIIIHVPTYV